MLLISLLKIYMISTFSKLHLSSNIQSSIHKIRSLPEMTTLDQLEYFCDECPFKTKLKRSTPVNNVHLKQHQRLIYLCILNQYMRESSTSVINVHTKQQQSEHVKSIHDGLRYTSEQCPFGTNWKRALSSHVHLKHE